MEVVYECGCGLDVHAKTIVAWVIKRGRRKYAPSPRGPRTYSSLAIG